MGETWEYFGSAFVNSCLQGRRDYSIESAHERFLFTILIYELRCLKKKNKKKKNEEMSFFDPSHEWVEIVQVISIDVLISYILRFFSWRLEAI